MGEFFNLNKEEEKRGNLYIKGYFTCNFRISNNFNNFSFFKYSWIEVNNLLKLCGIVQKYFLK